MEIRLEQLLEPVFNRILEQENNKKEPLNLQILEAANKQQNQNTDKENFNNEMER